MVILDCKKTTLLSIQIHASLIAMEMLLHIVYYTLHQYFTICILMHGAMNAPESASCALGHGEVVRQCP